MNIVSIPVSKVSYKILTKMYGRPPFKVNKQDMLWVQANFKNYNYKLKEDAVRALLTERIDLLVNKNEIKNMFRSGLYAGHCLNKYHMLMMCQFVDAQSRVGVSVSGAIDNFFRLYDIGEDDYSKDTAYKRMQRYNWAMYGEKKSINLNAYPRLKKVVIPRKADLDNVILQADEFNDRFKITDDQIKLAIKIRLLIDAGLQSYAEIKTLLNIGNADIKKALASYDRFTFRKKNLRDGYRELVNRLVV